MAFPCRSTTCSKAASSTSGLRSSRDVSHACEAERGAFLGAYPPKYYSQAVPLGATLIFVVSFLDLGGENLAWDCEVLLIDNVEQDDLRTIR